MKRLLSDSDLYNLKRMDVLFAEDDEVVMASMSTILSHYFRDVTVCRDGKAALESFTSRSFDLVILDIRMPVMDGLEVAEAIRKGGSDTPIVILTSYEAVEPLRRAVPLGLIDYLVKPLEIGRLESVLHSFLANAARTRLERVPLNRHCCFDRRRKAIVHSNMPEYAEPLTANECMLLELLIERKGAILHLEEIDLKIYDGQMTSHAIRNLLLRLREKLMDKETIKTHRGIGYSWNY